MTTYKETSEKFYPGLGSQFVHGLANVGYHAIDVTLACNTVRTNAQIIASPPNTSSLVNACGPVVHSLGVAPTAVIPILTDGPTSGLKFAVGVEYVTADNSAIYLRAACWTGSDPVGVSMRVIAVR